MRDPVRQTPIEIGKVANFSYEFDIACKLTLFLRFLPPSICSERGLTFHPSVTIFHHNQRSQLNSDTIFSNLQVVI